MRVAGQHGIAFEGQIGGEREHIRNGAMPNHVGAYRRGAATHSINSEEKIKHRPRRR